MSRHAIRLLILPVAALATLWTIPTAGALPPRGRMIAPPVRPMPMGAAPVAPLARERFPIVPKVPAPRLPPPPSGHELFPPIIRNIPPAIPITTRPAAAPAPARHVRAVAPHFVPLPPAGLLRSGFFAAFRGLSIPPFLLTGTPPAFAAFSTFPPQFVAFQQLPITPFGVALMNTAAAQAALNAAALGIPLSPASLFSFQFLNNGLGTALTVSNPFGFSSGIFPNQLVGGLNNPFSLASYPFNAAPYNALTTAGYGGGYGGAGYGGGYGGTAAAAQMTANYVEQQPAPEKQRDESFNVLTAFGVPNQDGHVDWPLGIRVLAPAAEMNKLREQIDTLAGMVLGQKTMYGQVDDSLVREMDRAVDRLRHQLAARSTDLPQNTYNDARLFLEKLQGAVKAMR